MGRVFTISRDQQGALACRVSTAAFEQNAGGICSPSSSSPMPKSEITMDVGAPTPSPT
ncbi:MAG: hypothetical protein KDJ26_07955 [Alphaproteobacteria bacterium]|jgi:hypothetical protein|nr:hypothetical protein [Alphaproteobacteria bacterium]MCB1551915.1 hypothetical protein [Alphaproteobacteria bacterium]MCB9984909.1 hypothetical protein [Micavibrio sp.]HPQ51323.1 hypothetical protein [Alphaproteobacteria bacterium]HRK97300.1 hypothetical protein [Alphaproteobacteria bacterium]